MTLVPHPGRLKEHAASLREPTHRSESDVRRIIAHQKSQLADAHRRWTVAVMAGDYDEAQAQAKRANRISTSLVQLGAIESIWDVDRQACAERDARTSTLAPLYGE